MSNEMTLLGLVAAIFLLGMILHWAYLKRVEKKLRAKSGGDFDLRSLKNAMQIHQGSNFNTMMLAAWSLFFVALAFLYFLTPSIFPKANYFKLAQIASDWWGLSGFGVMIVFITLGLAFAVPSLSLPWTYRFYVISRNTKKILTPAVPILLIISITSSFYLGTIYPKVDSFFWSMGYAALLAAQLLLNLPLFIGIMEEMR